MGGLVRISTGKAIQWRGSGHSLNRQTLRTEKLLSSSPCRKSALISRPLGATWEERQDHGGRCDMPTASTVRYCNGAALRGLWTTLDDTPTLSNLVTTLDGLGDKIQGPSPFRTRSNTTRDRFICNFGALSPLDFSEFSPGDFFPFLQVFSVIQSGKSLQNAEKIARFLGGETCVKSCHVSGCPCFFGPDSWGQQKRRKLPVLAPSGRTHISRATQGSLKWLKMA